MSRIRGQNDFGTKEVNCRPGESLHFEWNVSGPWRRLQEFNFGILKAPTGFGGVEYTNDMMLQPRFDYMYMKYVMPGVTNICRAESTEIPATTQLYYLTHRYIISGTEPACCTNSVGADTAAKIVAKNGLDDNLDRCPWVQEGSPIPCLFLKPAEMVGVDGSRLIQYMQIPFTLCYELELAGKYPEVMPSEAGWQQPTGNTSHNNFFLNRVPTVPFATPYIPFLFDQLTKKARNVLDMNMLCTTIYDNA